MTEARPNSGSSSVVLVSQPAVGVRQITMNRPDVLNAINHDLVAEMSAVLETLHDDPDCRVVVLTGSGRGFCAGLDLKDYGDQEVRHAKGAVRGLLEQQREIVGIAHLLHRLRQPVIAAVNGPAAGGGLGFVLASDIRIASAQANFTVSFINAGVSGCDIGTSWLLPRLIGAGRAHELMLTGRRVTAEEALRIGLIVEVVPATELLSRALKIAEAIMAHAPLSIELTKQGMWLALESPSFATAVELENRQQVVAAMTEDKEEAMRAWLERRTPEFHYR